MPDENQTWTPAKIRALRKSLGQTQAEFDVSMMVSPSTVTNWECGTCAPSELAEWRLDELDALADKNQCERSE